MEFITAALVGAVKWKVASSAVKLGLKALFPEQEPLRDLLGATGEGLLEHFKKPEEKSFITQLQKRMAAELADAFGNPKPERAREDPELQEAFWTILDTLDRAGEAAVHGRMDPAATGEALVALAHENPRWRYLAQVQREGCESVLRGIAEEIAGHAALFDGFDETAARDTLTALDMLTRGHQEIITRLNRILSNLPLDRHTEIEREDRQFEFRYRQVLISHLDRLELFGIDEVDEPARRYPLSIAFVRLRLSGHGDDQVPGRDRQAEEVLAANDRLLILGDAGSGKSTLLQWLAVHSAAGDLSGELAEWNQCVPFFIRLRHCVPGLREQKIRPVTLPSLAEWVAALSPNLRDAMPKDWADRQVKAGRVLLLVDGVDEVPEEFHGAVRSWVQELGTLGVRFRVVSSRPQLLPSWLRGFTECSVVPLDLGSAFELVDRWHEAVEVEEPRAARRTEIPARKRTLKAALSRPGPLRELMLNPLLCAMLCALNYRGSTLPHARMELYEACCRALIHEREDARQIALPDCVAWMTLRHRNEMLGSLAFWMVMNGYSEAPVTEVDNRLREKLELIPRTQLPSCEVRPEDIRKHFVQRSGLLREPVPGETVQFVHKTFMEFLAAREAVGQECYGWLLERVDRPDLAGVIRFAAGFVPNLEKSRKLFDGLLAEPMGPSIRRKLLAVSCLETCTVVSPELQTTLTSALEALVPPRSEETVQAIAGAGALALPFLVIQDDWDDVTRAWCITALSRIGGDDALLLLEAYAEDPGAAAREALIRAWSAFAPVDYARRILAPVLRKQTLFRPEGAVSLAGLEALPWLEELDLSGSPALTDLSPIFALPRLRTFTNKDGAPMVWVPPGEFMMGSPDADEEAQDRERPAHQVRITRGFWLARTPVTNAQYRRFVQSTGHREPPYWGDRRFGDDQQPVVGVDWEDAAAYSAWAGGRLPTEAEWEYAARGPEARQYPWGDAPPTAEHADFGQDWQEGRPAAVGSKAAGAAWCGALDLAGGVWEWCADWYGGEYYQSLAEYDPSGPVEGEARVVRGGSWYFSAAFLRSAYRYCDLPEGRFSFLGFRSVVVSGADPS